jgi:hypothetical protein
VSDPIEILLVEDNPADAFLVEEALSLTRLNLAVAHKWGQAESCD